MSTTLWWSRRNIFARGVCSYVNQSPYFATIDGPPLALKISGKYLTTYSHHIIQYQPLPADSNHRRLRSSFSLQLVIRPTRLSTVGNRAFPVAGSRRWNSQPPVVTSAPTLTVFRKASTPTFFPDHFLHNCFLRLVLYTMFSSGLAVLYFRQLLITVM